MSKESTKEERSEMARELGRQGGRAFVNKYGKGQMKKLAKRGAKARWGTEPRKKDDKRTPTNKKRNPRTGEKKNGGV